jgi:anti-sigma factor RsiW
MRDLDQDMARLLDGELTAAERAEAIERLRVHPETFARWQQLQRIVDTARQMPQPSVSEGFVKGVVDRIRAAKIVPFRRTMTPQRGWLRIAVAACIALIVGTGAGFGLAVYYPLFPPFQAHQDKIVYVRFVFIAPGTQDVRLVGDFNGWDADGLPLHESGEPGVWTATVPLQPGMYQYMFVVDGTQWVTDPAAEAYLDDGFGNRNAVLHVTIPDEQPPQRG